MNGKTNGGVFNPKNLSLFSYTYNNPVNLVDPNGNAVDPRLKITGAAAMYDSDVTSHNYSVEETDAAFETMSMVLGLGGLVKHFTADIVKSAGKNIVSKIKQVFEKKVAKEITPNAAQQKNLNRFHKKIPANAKENVETHELPSGGIAAKATSPGKVPGSKAVYEKQIDISGKTMQYTKTTYDPSDNIVHVKDKINGGILK